MYVSCFSTQTANNVFCKNSGHLLNVYRVPCTVYICMHHYLPWIKILFVLFSDNKIEAKIFSNLLSVTWSNILAQVACFKLTYHHSRSSRIKGKFFSVAYNLLISYSRHLHPYHLFLLHPWYIYCWEILIFFSHTILSFSAQFCMSCHMSLITVTRPFRFKTL